MKHVFSCFSSRLGDAGRLLALVALMAVPPAHADDHGDVTQLIRSGKHTRGHEPGRSYLLAKPRDPQMRFLKGVAQTEAGKQADAIATFTKLTEDYPELPEPYNNLAVLHASLSQYDKARAALEMAIRTNPSYATAHENLGDVYAKLASQAYTKALQLDAANTAVPPKLSLIRDLFAPGNKAQKPVAPPPIAVAPLAKPLPAPAAVSPASAPGAKPGAAPDAPGTREVESAVRAWASAWSARDVPTYLAAYGRTSTPGPVAQGLRKTGAGASRARATSASSSVRWPSASTAPRPRSRFRQDYAANG
jgi:tetratricopeptide (TPR) repeat protein